MRFVQKMFIFIFVILVSPSAVAQRQPIATVDGEEITEADIKLAELEWQDRVTGLSAEDRRRVLLELLLEAQLEARAAREEKLLSPDQQTDLERFSARLALRGVYFGRKIREQVTEKDVRQFYDEQVKQLPAEEEVKASHIIVDNFELATELAAKLVNGSNFSELARHYSQDPTSSVMGGSLGYFARSQVIPQIAQAAFALQRGEVSKPVKSQLGWHIVRVDDRRIRPNPPFDEVKVQLTDLLVRRKAQDVFSSLRDKAKIELKIADLGLSAHRAVQEVASQTSPIVPSSSSTSTGFSVYDNRDIAGNDIEILKKVEQQACAQSCQSNKACVAYSYDRWNKWCFIKAQAQKLTIDPSSTSGVRAEVSQPDASSAEIRIEKRGSKRLLGQSKTETSETLDTCEHSCQERAACVGYSFSSKDRKCTQFESVSSFISAAGTTSGFKTQTAP